MGNVSEINQIARDILTRDVHRLSVRRNLSRSCPAYASAIQYCAASRDINRDIYGRRQRNHESAAGGASHGTNE